MPRTTQLLCPLLVLALLAVPASAGRTLQQRQLGGGALSPVTRIVELLKSLHEKVTQEGKAEEDLFTKFVCWAKSIITAKEASNSEAESTLGVLNTYVADLDAGRITLTTEQADLERQLEQLHADMELAQSMRTAEENDFLSAKEDMQNAIAALTAAIEVLKTATKDHKEGVLLGLRGQVVEAAGEGSAEVATLTHAVDLGDKFLTKGDALFLRRLLTGEVPTWDWKKLNRPATFKKSYKARSFKIQSVLVNLLQTFELNLREAEGKERDAKSTFSSLMTAKGTEKGVAQDALSSLETETKTRGMSRSESLAKIDMLTEQVRKDKIYIDQVKEALQLKRQEWENRKVLRTGELEAISKAISILHGDESRDIFKKSFTSQAYSLMQESADVSSAVRRANAAATLRVAAYAAHDKRLAELATRVAADGHFTEVIQAINNMLTLLQNEEDSDLQKKDTCESERATDTRDAAKSSRTIDEKTDLITRLEAEIKDLTAQIDTNTEEVKGIDAQLVEAKEQRDQEHAQYLVAKKDDEDAKALVEDARVVLTNFYQENGLALSLTQRRQKQPEVVAGQAPPPPPKTWDEPYGGKTGEASGIVAVLAMIKEDIQKDLDNTQAAEDKAAGLYTETKQTLEDDKRRLNELITELELEKGQKGVTVSDTKGERSTEKDTLYALMRKIGDAEPGCNFFTVKFPIRSKNRQIEMDGLEKAKAVLMGATFAPPEDPMRPIVPGDALLQHAKQHRQ